VACGSAVEDFSSTSLLLLLHAYTSAATPATRLQPCASAFSYHFIHPYYVPIKTTNACRFLFPLLSVSGVFSPPLRQHLLFPCEQLLCNIIKSSLCFFNLFWFRGGGCIAYLQLIIKIIKNLYSHQKLTQIRKSQHCRMFLYS